MGVIVKKRGPVVKNLIIFVALSVVYLFVVQSINAGKTALNYEAFKSYCFNNLYILCFALVAIYFIFKVKVLSKWILLVFFGIIRIY